ncbi:hypothetical protein FOCC_FOCC002687 [Frankliniella occidentalis]|nr:hypothetical protein FOCC_FOCC002687 [Frankliniella occidentalis]
MPIPYSLNYQRQSWCTCTCGAWCSATTRWCARSAAGDPTASRPTLSPGRQSRQEATAALPVTFLFLPLASAALFCHAPPRMRRPIETPPSSEVTEDAPACFRFIEMVVVSHAYRPPVFVF